MKLWRLTRAGQTALDGAGHCRMVDVIRRRVFQW
jgi:hypothetical protein